MEALKSDAKLSDAFTTLKHEDNKIKALQEMKDHMMLKAALFDGGDENDISATASRFIAVLAHQVGRDDDDIYTLLINK